MAFQSASVSLAAANTGTFTFNKPTGSYQKNFGVTTSGGPFMITFAADVDNMDGTMTGTVNASSAVTATVTIAIYDTP